MMTQRDTTVNKTETVTTTLRRGAGRHRARPGKVLAGCLIVLAIVVVLLVGAGVFVAMNWKGWAAGGINAVATELINDTNLPEGEKQEVLTLVENLSNEFGEGNLSFEELGMVMQEITTGPIIPASVAAGFDQQYVAPSELSEEEKADARLALDRLARGMAEGKIPQTRLPGIMEPISAPAGQAPVQINTGEATLNLKAPDDCTADEIRAVIANASAQADEADVPMERYDFDMSDELSRAIRDALGRDLPGMTGSPGAEALPEAEPATAEDVPARVPAEVPTDMPSDDGP